MEAGTVVDTGFGWAVDTADDVRGGSLGLVEHRGLRGDKVEQEMKGASR